ncbi:hypothetical protein ACFOWB_01410 [Chenggangzhangella methanolivorans]|uniref:hypothetical protein n=1 Tax=Chenggangzhangella methanolivorans TaxID=1437009 RepID=UPI0036188A2A
MLIRTLSAIAGLAFASIALAAPAGAQTKPNIVVMGEDADQDSVPRGNRIFQRVIAELGETMNLRGYNVYDETAVAMSVTQPGRVRRRDAELIDVARAVQQPPLDVVVVFQIYASAQKSMYSDIVRPEVRVAGRLLNVRTGQGLGSFETTGQQLPPLPQGCDRECLLEKVGAEAKTLANDLSNALGAKLDGFIGSAPSAGGGAVTDVAPAGGGSVGAPAPAGDACGGMPTAYVIKVQGFSAEEMQRMEEYSAAFSCYASHRPVRASGGMAEYWYETRSDSARLNRNLRLMLDHMGSAGQVTFTGNTFTIAKVATR